MMKSIKLHIIYISVILLLIGGFFIQRNHYIKQKPIVETIIKTDTTIVEKEIIKYSKPKIVEKIVPIEKEIIKTRIDTVEVIKDYSTKKIYTDNIKLDSLGYLTITDTLYKNDIISRETVSNIKIPVIKETITNTIYAKPRNEFYLGVNAQFSPNSINYVGPSISLRTKKKSLYTISIGVDPANLNSLQYNIGIGAKIGKK